jgi:Mrp family chromosome partitioning ATPase
VAMNNTSALGSVMRRWWVPVLLAVIGAVAGALPEPERVEDQIRTFTATHTLLLNDSENIQFSNPAVSPNQVPLFVTTGEVPARAAEALGFDGNPASLASQVNSEFAFDTGALTITTTQTDAAFAESVADAFADELVLYLAERQDLVYQNRISATLERLSALEVELNSLTQELGRDPENPVLQAQQSAVSRQYSVAFEQSEELAANPPLLGFTTLQRAQAVEITDRGLSAPTSRSSRALIGAVVGLALGVGIALLLGRVDRRLRTRDQAEEITDLRARVLIPRVKDPDRDRLVVAAGRHDPLSDSYRTVRNVVGFVLSGREPSDQAPVTLVVSPGPGDGKTSLAVNLAAAFAETGQRTALVNTDFRRPRMSQALGLPTQHLPFLPEDLPVLDTRALLSKTDRAGLVMMDLSAIDGSPSDLVRGTTDKLGEICRIADTVVIDTSPVGATAEVLELVPHADVILVTIRLGHTTIQAAQRTVGILRDLTRVPILLVITGAKQERVGYYEYVSRGSGEAPASDAAGGRRRLRRSRRQVPPPPTPATSETEQADESWPSAASPPG